MSGELRERIKGVSWNVLGPVMPLLRKPFRAKQKPPGFVLDKKSGSLAKQFFFQSSSASVYSTLQFNLAPLVEKFSSSTSSSLPSPSEKKSIREGEQRRRTRTHRRSVNQYQHLEQNRQLLHFGVSFLKQERTTEPPRSSRNVAPSGERDAANTFNTRSACGRL